jgi:hypothetical protein
MIDPNRYRIRGYEEYRERAKDSTLSLNEKCATADAFRSGYNEQILGDIIDKMPAFGKPGVSLCDIGAGCSELAQLIVERTSRNRQSLTVIDSPEMMELLPDDPHLTKVEGPFPQCLGDGGRPLGPFDAILCYGVVGAVFEEANLFAFVDAAAALLADHGQLLLGDIPNASMRKRFMASPAGAEYHKIYYAHLPRPEIVFNTPTPGEIDDGVILGLVARLRGAGFNAFVMPQAAGLPMANRREDILITRC